MKALRPLLLTTAVALALSAPSLQAAPDATSSASKSVKKADATTSASKALHAEASQPKALPAWPTRQVTVVETLEPNTYSFIDPQSSGVVINGHTYEYDTLSGATVKPSRSVVKKPAIALDVKERLMYWTNEPPLGLIEGEYYGTKFTFGHNRTHFIASADLVVNNGKIVHLEMDEQLSPEYYDKKWASHKKRRSGYTFFQQSKQRTDDTLVTWGNGITFIEYQVLKWNSLNLDFDTVHGSSNSARDAFIPAVGKLKDMVAKPSGQYYLGLTLPLENGLLARLELVFEGKRIIRANYDEVFPDLPDQIKDPALKKYYRTSKFESVFYEGDGNAFREWATQLNDLIVKENSLQVSMANAPAEFKNFEMLAKKIAPAVERYLAHGYQHNIGDITKTPKGFKMNPLHVSRVGEIGMKVLGTRYDPATETMTVSVQMSNTSAKPYDFHTKFFYSYALSNGTLDTVADPDAVPTSLAPKSTRDYQVKIRPIRPDDKNLTLKFDGPNKIYFAFNIEKNGGEAQEVKVDAKK